MSYYKIFIRSIIVFHCMITGITGYSQYTTPAQWNQIRADRERQESRDRQQQKDQELYRKNNYKYTPGSSSNNSKVNEQGPDIWDYPKVTEERVELGSSRRIESYSPYGIYTGGKKRLMNIGRTSNTRYGQGRLEVFNFSPYDGIYEGQWNDKDMYGTYTGQYGYVYTGNFKEFKIYGDGSVKEGGATYNGTFVNGKITKVSSIEYGPGVIYKGGISNQSREGFGHLTYADGKIEFLGNWMKDKKNGIGTTYLRNGQSKRGVWIDDKEEGQFQFFDAGDKLISTVFYTAGKLDKPTPVTVNKVKPVVKGSTAKKPVSVPGNGKPLPVERKNAFLRQGTNSKYGFVDSNGYVIIPIKYDYAAEFCDGLAFVTIKMKVGFIDNAGRIIIPLVYDNGISFQEGLAAVKKDRYWGYIDTRENIIIPFIYDDANSFKNGIAVVKLNGETYNIDKSGKRK